MENVNMNEVTEVTEVLGMIEALEDSAKLKDVIAKVNEIIAKLNETKQPKARDRGPDSQREMTEDDATRVLIGDMKDMSHKAAAEALGLSYGQIYSSRKGFTFKAIYKTWRDAQAK